MNFATLIFDEEDLFFEAPWLIFWGNFDNFSKILMENFSDTDIVFITSDELSMFIVQIFILNGRNFPYIKDNFSNFIFPNEALVGLCDKLSFNIFI